MEIGNSPNSPGLLIVPASAVDQGQEAAAKPGETQPRINNGELQGEGQGSWFKEQKGKEGTPTWFAVIDALRQSAPHNGGARLPR